MANCTAKVGFKTHAKSDTIAQTVAVDFGNDLNENEKDASNDARNL